LVPVGSTVRIFTTSTLMSNPIVKEKNSIPLTRSTFRNLSQGNVKFASPVRRYKFKSGYGGLITRKINPIKYNMISPHQRTAACQLVQQSQSLRECIAKSTVITDPDFRYQVVRSYSALEFWQKTPGRKIDHFKDVIKKNILGGVQYSKDIKDIFAYGMRRYLLDKGKYKHSDGKEYLVDTYNYTPPLNYLIMYEEEFDDMTECFSIPSVDIEDDIKEEVETIMMGMLPDSLDKVKKESLFIIKTSSSSNVKLEKSKHYVESSKGDISYTMKFRARRERIQIAPQNNRDIGICDLPTYYTVRMLDEYFLQILKGLESSALGSSGLMRKIKEHFRTGRSGTNFFYMRDYKKSALTFSHKLLQVIIDILLKKYGEDHDLKYLKMYLNQEIRDKDKFIYPKRGFPLGMGNHLYTLVNIIATQMLRNRIPVCLKTNFLAGNDDSSLNVNIEDDEMSVVESMDLIMRTDLELHESLDMILNDKKMFCAFDSVFFEEYSNEAFSNKESLFFAGIGATRLCETIAEAKLHCSNILSFCKFNISPLLEEVVTYFGWEFFPTEHLYDYTLGGWYHTPRKNGLDIINTVPEESLYDLSRAIKSVKETAILFHDDKNTISSGKVSERYGIHPLRLDYDEDDPIRDFLIPNNRIYNRGSKLEKFTADLDVAFRNVQRRRMNIKGHTKRWDLFCYYLRAYSEHDIPESCIEELTHFYNTDVVCDNINDFIYPDQVLEQFLLAKEIEGFIEVDEYYTDYISKYNSKYLGKLLRSKPEYEAVEIGYRYPVRYKESNGTFTEVLEKGTTMGYVLYTCPGSEIPYGLGTIANNPINRYVNDKYIYPKTFKDCFKEIICTPRSVTCKWLTEDENYLINNLEESEVIDQTRLWHSLSEESRPYISKFVQTIERFIRNRRKETTQEELAMAKLNLCDKHANGHSIDWDNLGTYPNPKGMEPNKCYLCDTYLDWYYRVTSSLADPRKEQLSLKIIIDNTRSIVDFDDPIPGWFEPPDGDWGLIGQIPQEETIPEEEAEMDNEQDPEDGDEIIEEVEDEDIDGDVVEDDEIEGDPDDES